MIGDDEIIIEESTLEDEASLRRIVFDELPIELLKCRKRIEKKQITIEVTQLGNKFNSE